MPAERHAAWEWRDEAPDGSAWAAARIPALPSVAECNPAAAHWRDLLIDPDLAGLVPGRARPTRLAFRTRDEQGDGWRPPLDGVLATGFAWHPHRPLVAGLLVRDRRAHPWIADYEERTVTVLTRLRAAVSFTGSGRPPVAWCGDRLALLVPAAGPDGPAGAFERPSGRPVVFEASGPRIVSFEPPPEELERLAGARLIAVDPGADALCEPGAGVLCEPPLTPPMLVRGLLPAPGGDGVVVSAGRWEAGELHWTDLLIDLTGRAGPRPAPSGSTLAPPARRDEPPEAPRASGIPLPTGHGTARLALPPSGTGPLLLWIRAFHPGSDLPCPAPVGLDRTGHPVATLDLPLHWPSGATLGSLRSQILDTVETARKHWDGPVAVGGHSFGATLALYALAHIPDLVSAIAHSGCYNRTLTPTGFHHERRPHWEIPEIYRAFSALCSADLIDRPVLLVHGAEDANPATPPEQSVELYRAVVAAGGRARLVLLPHEGHHYRYRETHDAVAAEHDAWMDRW